MTHPLLERQLKKAGLEAGSLPANLAAWTGLLEHINRAYTEHEQDRYLLERSLTLASEEMEQEIAERKRSEEEVRVARDELERQNRQLVRVHELLRAVIEQMAGHIERGASKGELTNDLRMVQAEFERLDKPKVNGNKS
jgi:hypothetical protein